MTQGVLPFKHEKKKNDTGMTALAGLPIHLDLAKVIGSKGIHWEICTQKLLFYELCTHNIFSFAKKKLKL